MYNLFTTDDLSGMITAAYYHAVARHTKGGVHVVYCRDDLTLKVGALSNTIAMAHSWGHKLPDVRFIVLAGVDTTPEANAILDQLEDDDGTVCVQREPHMELTHVKRALLHALLHIYCLFHDREETMHKLSGFLYNRLYGVFSTRRM